MCSSKTRLQNMKKKIEKEVAKAKKRFGDSFDEAKYRETSPRVLEQQQKRDALQLRFAQAMEANDLKELRQIIEDCGIVDPISGTRNWTDVRQFNLMFKTEMGSSSDSTMDVYLRPETAQGIFVNFLNVQKTGRMRIPFGIAQIGKAFRNEIVARQFIFRMREFEQMEMQFFVPRAMSSNGLTIGKNCACSGIKLWAWAPKTIATTTTRNLLTMPMQPPTSSLKCPLALKRLKAFTVAPTST